MIRLSRGVAAAGLALFWSGAAIGQDLAGFGKDVASVTYGPYVRAEIGHGSTAADDGFWAPPGPADPQIFFDLDADDGTTGAVAIGFDWQNGWRMDASFGRFTGGPVAGPCIAASDGTACDIGPTLDNHADIESASFSASTLMANLFYAPFEAKGSHSRFQPFVVGGLGLSRNKVGVWTRENNNSGLTDRPTRAFAGASSTRLAWSVGIGAAWQLTPPGKRPVIVEASWRYYDFGKASGGSSPLPENGTSQPRDPLTFDASSSVFSVGIRIPLKRY